jgi:hypothetical protein
MCFAGIVVKCPPLTLLLRSFPAAVSAVDGDWPRFICNLASLLRGWICRCGCGHEGGGRERQWIPCFGLCEVHERPADCVALHCGCVDT